MKRSIFAIAVAGALTLGAAQAETVLYGSIRFDYSSEKRHKEVTETNQFGQTYTRIKNERVSNMNDVGSRLGLKGGETLGNGVQVVYQLEWGFDGMEGLGNGGDFKNRLAYIGLAGDFGLFAVGRLDNPFKQTLVDDSVIDSFNSTSTSSAMSAVVEAFGFDARENSSILDRLGNVIAYVSPDWNGFQFNVALVLDDDLKASGVGSYDGWNDSYWTTYERYNWDATTGWSSIGIYNNSDGLANLWGAYNDLGLDHKKQLDAWTINALYKHESGFFVKAGYMQGNTRSDDKSKAWGLHAGYQADQFGVTAAYADGNYKANQGAAWLWDTATGASSYSPNNKWKSDTKGFDVGARFSFGPNYDSSVRVNYGQYEVKDRYTTTGLMGIDADFGFKRKYKTWAVGFEQKLSSRTRVWAEYANRKPTYSENNHYTGWTANTASVEQSKTKPKSEDRFSLGIRHDF